MCCAFAATPMSRCKRVALDAFRLYRKERQGSHKRDTENYKHIARMLGSLPDGIREKMAGNLADRSWFFVGNMFTSFEETFV